MTRESLPAVCGVRHARHKIGDMALHVGPCDDETPELLCLACGSKTLLWFHFDIQCTHEVPAKHMGVPLRQYGHAAFEASFAYQPLGLVCEVCEDVRLDPVAEETLAWVSLVAFDEYSCCVEHHLSRVDGAAHSHAGIAVTEPILRGKYALSPLRPISVETSTWFFDESAPELPAGSPRGWWILRC